MTGRAAIRAAARLARRVAGEAAGNLSIEFAFIVPVLMLLAVGALEAGRLYMEHLRMTGAARAGLQYGLQDPGAAADIAGILRAARAGAGEAGTAYAVEARKFCACPSGSEADCATSCPADEDMRTYVEVTVAGEVELLFAYPALPRTLRLSARQAQRLN
jgi:Flp pilus assembly protein TadG